MTPWQIERDRVYYANQYRQAFKQCAYMKLTGDKHGGFSEAWNYMRTESKNWLIEAFGPEEPARVLGAQGDDHETEG